MSSASAASAASHHIAFGVDSHYVRGIGVLIASILDNNRGTRFIFHVFTFAISEENRRRLQQIEASSGMPVHVHVVDPAVFGEYAHFPNFAQYSAAIFTRLLIPGLLEGVTDQVLYLDADILCLGNLKNLLDIDLSNDIVAVSMDNGEETARRQCAALHLKARRYFNSGMLYIHIPNWIANRITEQTMQVILQSNHALLYPDQDALNVVLDGRARVVDARWNSQYTLANFLKNGCFRMTGLGNAVLVHFTGRVKPWHDWSLHDVRTLFLRYQRLSPWEDAPLDGPKNYKEMRMFSTYLRQRRRFAQSAHWYIRYLAEKFFSKGKSKSL